MNRFQDIENFLELLSRAPNLEVVRDLLSKHVAQLGFPFFSFALMSAEGPTIKPIYITNFPSRWRSRYREERYASDDLVVSYAAQAAVPFSWTRFKRRNAATKRQTAVFDEAADCGLGLGITIPIHGPGSTKAHLSVASNMKQAEFSKLATMQRHELLMIATYVYDKILQLKPWSHLLSAVALTARESEILTWVARGKTSWEIGNLLSISEATVKEHNFNISRKFGVHNKTHAASIAIVRGMIIP